VQIAYPVQSNAVFARMPERVVHAMHQRGWKFYTHVGQAGEARLMCSWDTTEDDVDSFAAHLREQLAGAPAEPAPRVGPPTGA
jgi:threonine aldolase